MDKEIKIHFDSANQALDKLRDKTNALKVTLPKEIGSENQLEVIDRLNEINSNLQKLIVNYHSLLTGNETKARESLKSLQEFEKSIIPPFQIK